MAQVIQLTDDIYQFEPGSSNMSSAVFFISGPPAAIVETGPGLMVPHIIEGIRQVGSRPEDVAFILVTHVHMDHAGGLGTLAKLLPQAKAIVHKEGARHALGPSKLIAGTKMAFGDDFEKTFGTIEAVSPAQLVAVSGGESFPLNGRQLQIIDAPGHAPHHLCIFDTKSRGLFAGEALGCYRAEADALVPAVAAPAFDLDQTMSTTDRLEALDPAIIFYSHQGSSRDVRRLIGLARKNTVAFGEIILAALKEKATYEVMSRRLEDYLAAQTGFPGKPAGPPGSNWQILLQGYEIYFKKKGLV